MRRLFGLLVFLAVVAGASYGVYHFAIKDRVTDESPEAKECKVELSMIKTSIDAALKERQSTGLDLVDPGTYIDKSVTLKYYTWEPAAVGWVPKPIGTPPC